MCFVLSLFSSAVAGQSCRTLDQRTRPAWSLATRRRFSCSNVLCERPVHSRLTLREEGQVELFGETPNGLSASVILANGDGECQYYFCQSPIRVAETSPAFTRTHFFPGRYEIKLTANSCIALCSSRNALSFSSGRTTRMFSLPLCSAL